MLYQQTLGNPQKTTTIIIIHKTKTYFINKHLHNLIKIKIEDYIHHIHEHCGVIDPSKEHN